MFGLIRRVYAALMALFSILLLWSEGPKQKADFLEPLSTQTFMLFEAYTRGQSVTTDGRYYYFSSNYGIIKTELDGRTVVRRNLVAIPLELLKLGCKHIGGISYMEGKIYAPIEDSKVFEHLYIAVYDANTLRFIESFALPLERHEFGVPWCVADPETGYVYSARRDHITEIVVYDAETMAFAKTIKLESPVHKVQGGAMHDGILYLSVSRDDQAVYAIQLASGKVRKAISRNLMDDSEGEGMAALPTPDGAFFHVLDIASVRVGVHFRHYAFDPASIKW